MTKFAFKDVRLDALKLWREGTKRNGETDTCSAFVDAFECQWQENYAGGNHNNFFCSLGEFATNIDDILEDKRLDDIEIEGCQVKEENTGKLYRYFCRILLITEQIIEDFETALKLKKEDDWRPVQLKKFVNWIIKHRSDPPFHFNSMNNHLIFLFEGTQANSEDESLISFESFTNHNFNIAKVFAILLPPLSSIIDILIMCYQRLDERLKDTKFRDEFNSRYCLIET